MKLRIAKKVCRKFFRTNCRYKKTTHDRAIMRTKVKEHPKSFTPEKLKAIKDGRATQFREPIKARKVNLTEFDRAACVVQQTGILTYDSSLFKFSNSENEYYIRSRYKLGDTFTVDGETYEVTDVRVQRLQDISEEDARAEGVSTIRDMRFAVALGNLHSGACRLNFIELWQSIYGADSWAANHWVWTYTFRRVTE